MKRKCKTVDITNIEFIEDAIKDCMAHKTGKKRNKRQIVDFLSRYNNDEHQIALTLQSEIKNRCLEIEPTRTIPIIDKSNGKERVLTIEHIKQQMYDYIAVHGLEELYSRYGYYQINVRKHGSPLMAVRYTQGWLNDKDIKYVIHMDIKKCYPSITKENMMCWIHKHIANDALLWLIEQLLSTSERGLPIGSRLSIELCALYLSDMYHHLESNYYYSRKGKKVPIYKHWIFFLDDVFLFGSNARKMTNAMPNLIDAYASKGLTIKPDWNIVCLKKNRKDTHIDMLGYKVYHDHITMRRRDYIKTRQALNDFKKHPNSVKKAQTFISMYGLFIKHTNSIKFRKKYKADKYYKKARKVVSNYDKSNVFREASPSYSNYNRRQKAVHNLPT